jgi:signal peptidase I
LAESPTEIKGKKKKKKKRSFLAELPFLIIIAVAVAVIIKTFFVQTFWIPSGSMIPELEVNDRVMVNRLAYAFAAEPERGDIVVFDSPFADGDAEDDEPVIRIVLRTIGESLGLSTAAVPDDLIKRVVGVGGETVEIRDNVVLIDEEALDEPYLPQGVNMADMAPRTLRADEVFVMGDNRNGSVDSRRFGPITLDHIVGRTFVRIWPFSRFEFL